MRPLFLLPFSFIFVHFVAGLLHVCCIVVHFLLLESFLFIFGRALYRLDQVPVCLCPTPAGPAGCVCGMHPTSGRAERKRNELKSELVHFGNPKPQTREKQGGPGWEGTIYRGDACPQLPSGRRVRRLERHGKPQTQNPHIY